MGAGRGRATPPGRVGYILPGRVALPRQRGCRDVVGALRFTPSEGVALLPTVVSNPLERRRFASHFAQ